MSARGRLPRLARVLLGVLAAPLSAQDRLPADLERFYSAPSLVGTPPRAVTWAPDSRRAAFLWAEDGSNTLDAYVVAIGAAGVPERRRLTALPRATVPAATAPAPDGSPLGYTMWRAQRAALAAELDNGVSALAWLPDASRLVATARGDLWLVDATVTAPPARRLTATRESESRVVIAPRRALDGATLVAFVRNGDAHVARLVGDSLHEARRLTTLSREAAGVEAITWSPDGQRLLIVDVDRSAIRLRGIPDYLGEETAMPMVRRAMPGEPSEMRRVGLVDANGGEVRWLPVTTDRFDVLHGVQWSPDGRRIVLDVSDVFVKHRRVLVVDGADTDTPDVQPVVVERDSANVSAEWQVAWSADGRRVLFTSDRETDYHVWSVPAGGGTPVPVTRGAWAVFGFAASARGVFVTANAGRAEERHVWRVASGTGSLVPMTRQPGTHTVSVSPDGRWGLDLFSSDTIPPDLHLLDLTRADATPQRVTTSPRPEFARYRFAPARYVQFASRADGATLHARLLLPPTWRPGTRVPLIMGSAYSNTARNQWGGRNAHPLWGLDQVLLEQGFAILAVDVAGSSGHGTAFRRRIRLDYGGIDVEDLHSAVEWAVREGIADSARVGIWGSSYGGLLTTMSLFTKPQVYRAGIAGAPATNVWHALTGEQRVMLRPQEHMDAYARASSHTKADGLRGSLMLIHGMRDAVVLYKDSAWLTQYLLQLGKDVELLTLPDAGHGWDLEGLAQTRFAFRRMVAFFRRTLLANP